MYPTKRPTQSPQSYYIPHISPHKSSKHNLSVSQKYYTQQQVHKLIKSYCQPKLMYLKNQLDQRQLYIQKLNNLLDQNDSKIHRLQDIIQNFNKKHRDNRGNDANVTHIVNQMLNQRLRHYWETIQSRIQQKLHKLDQYSKQLHLHLQTRIKSSLQQSKGSISSHIQLMREKNNSYWLKIKQSLTRLNSKILKADQSQTQLSQNFTHWKSSQQNLSFDIEMNKNVIKKFVQLKKSVNNIYQNYQNLLEMQEQFRKRLESAEHNDSYVEQQNRRYAHTISTHHYNHNHQNNRNNNYNNNNFKDYKANHGMGFAMLPNKNGNKESIKQINFQASQDLIDLQYSREQTNFIGVSNINSPKIYIPSVSINQVTNQLSQASNNLLKAKGFFQSSQKPSPLSSTPQSPQKHISHSPISRNIQSPSFLQNSQGFSCLNSTTNPHPNSRSNSFINMSLEHRKEMMTSVRERLQELISIKGLQKPLKVLMDQISYLKNVQGNYIFDLKGNMFKLNAQDANAMQQAGILSFINKDTQHGHLSKTKLIKQTQI